jgi:hypothetical protein
VNVIPDFPLCFEDDLVVRGLAILGHVDGVVDGIGSAVVRANAAWRNQRCTKYNSGTS